MTLLKLQIGPVQDFIAQGAQHAGFVERERARNRRPGTSVLSAKLWDDATLAT